MAREALATEFLCGIHRESARAVVSKDLFEKMHARQVATIALSVAVALQLHKRQQILGPIIAILHLQHPCEGQRDFVEGPTIQAVEIHRGRLDSVIDFECVIYIRCAKESLTDSGRALTDRERRPFFFLRPLHESVKLFASFENHAHRQAGLEFRNRRRLGAQRREARAKKKKEKDDSQHAPHDWHMGKDVKRESEPNRVRNDSA